MKRTADPILFCACSHADAIPAEKKRAVAAGLESCGRPVVIVPDVCGCAARRDPVLREIADAGCATVIACHPRAVQALFAWAGAPLDPARVQFLDMRAESAETLLAAITCVAGAPAAIRREPDTAADAGDFWRPWFPVIDYARCVNCRQCLEFCLFGVYETEADGRVAVRHPDHCKNNCPSCARLCPHMAIMFPKIDEESPVSGASGDAGAAGKVRLTQEQLFGSNALDKLRARQQRPRLLKTEHY
jgi:Pyruvate/2-oxoacid:ferredoxin oxidoreductase delta subunit